MFTAPLQFIKDRVLRLLLPVIQEDIPEEFRQAVVRGDTLLVVRLGEQLDVAGQPEDGPGGLGQDRGGDGSLVRQTAVDVADGEPAVREAIRFVLNRFELLENIVDLVENL